MLQTCAHKIQNMTYLTSLLSCAQNKHMTHSSNVSNLHTHTHMHTHKERHFFAISDLCTHTHTHRNDTLLQYLRSVQFCNVSDLCTQKAQHCSAPFLTRAHNKLNMFLPCFRLVHMKSTSLFCHVPDLCTQQTLFCHVPDLCTQQTLFCHAVSYTHLTLPTSSTV